MRAIRVTPPLIAPDLVRCGARCRCWRSCVRGARATTPASTREGARCRRGARSEGASVGCGSRERVGLRGAAPTSDRSASIRLGSLRAGDVLWIHGCGERAFAGEVDAIATYAEYDAEKRAFFAPLAGRNGRVVAAAGPIPADLIVARAELGSERRDRVRRALFGLSDVERASLIPLMNAERFAEVDGRHLDALRAMAARAAEGALTPLRPFLRPPL